MLQQNCQAMKHSKINSEWSNELIRYITRKPDFD